MNIFHKIFPHYTLKLACQQENRMLFSHGLREAVTLERAKNNAIEIPVRQVMLFQTRPLSNSLETCF